MVWWLAKKIHRRSPLVDLDDLAGEVRVGFVVAANRFDPARGLKFGTYAIRWGWRYGVNYCQRESAGGGIYVPAGAGFKRRVATSLHARAGDCEVGSLMTDPRQESPAVGVGDWLAGALRHVPVRTRQMIELYYFGDKDRPGVGLTLGAIGKRFGVCKERSRQIIVTGLTRIRQARPDLADLLDERGCV
jgi:RNA polymerase sigma factor (sigma-70 family)